MQPSVNVELALVNGKIITINPKNDIAQAVAVSDEKIVSIGSTKDILDLAGKNATVIDLEGKIVTPGFIENHCHPSLAGPMFCFDVDLRKASSLDDILKLLSEKSSELSKGKWLKGVGYDDRKIKEKRHPTKYDLDKIVTDHPIYLTRTDGHLGVANSKALQMAGITSDTPDPDGGTLDRDPDTGEPNGVLREKAQNLVKTIVPPYSIEEIKEGLIVAFHQLASWGITSVNDAAVVHDSLVAYQELLADDKMPLRVGMMIVGLPMLEFPGYLNELKKLGLKAGFGNKRLKIYGTKFMSDGSMSGWTAAFHEPYSNEPNQYGIIVTPLDELTSGIVEAHKAGLRPVTHAIGDRAIDIVLDAIEKALKERPAKDHRMTIEHCTLPTEEAINRIKNLGVLPSSSIGFLYELGPAHLLGIGEERAKRYFPHRTYLEKGIISVGNSDWFVTSANIVQQIYGAVTRKGYTGDVIGAEQAISVMDAIRLYTINGAYASFEEKIKGSIELGKLADMVVLDRDIFTIPKEEIKDTKVAMTIVGGKIIYQREKK
jgi:hypothetical protein